MLMVSIIGDSISTYSGYNPKEYAVFYDAVNQYRNGLTSVPGGQRLIRPYTRICV